MPDEIAIKVENLGKRYEIGDDDAGYELLTETISHWVRTFGRGPKHKEFWALKNINFEVRRGETLGIIGHNGAGKSTLLKILSRITLPTEGRAVLHGRVGALLEVGTGFHQELTGRENIFLNGAILNMSRAEIIRKFDEIVEFADIGPFIDTPVKRYSSGMQMRLAFSVAAHLEPEILIVDEVLSVGDLAFQEKCLGRMEQVSREGRTVVFISHNLGSVLALCDSAIMLSKGEIASTGSVRKVVDDYVGDIVHQQTLHLSQRTDRHGNGALRFTEVWFERDGKVVDSPTTGSDCDIVLSYETPGGPVKNANFGVMFGAMEGGAATLNLDSETTGSQFEVLPSTGQVRCSLPRFPLPPAQYFIHIWAESGGTRLDEVHSVLVLTVAGGDFFGTGRMPRAENRTVLVDQKWGVEPTEDEPSDLAAQSSSSSA
ncbi:MAG: lipopolysaccharide transport system ATP-binding protein [Solirubrobacterales bacterium]|jgi:lipopolysaccharide transport system ATP-binding protein|nr:lipopolysaccharide transport system ATP-binding protein [Solirubrobacterales bacterium]